MRFHLYTFLAVIFLIQVPSQAFEVVNQQRSFENNRLFSIGTGLGISQFSRGQGIDGGNPGFVWQTTLGHRFSQVFEAQFVYQLSTMRFNSRDPITPTTSSIQTRAGLHREYLLLKAYYPSVVAQPYVGVGFGAYQFFSVNGETALSFPASYEVPLAAGVQTFIYKNSISLDFDFTYHLMFGQNQDAATLSILKLKEVSFDMFTLIGGFTFHFL